jgi:hypothetical protein
VRDFLRVAHATHRMHARDRGLIVLPLRDTSDDNVVRDSCIVHRQVQTAVLLYREFNNLTDLRLIVDVRNNEGRFPTLRADSSISFCARASRRPLMTTLTPFLARIMAVALPIPVAPPLTNATFWVMVMAPFESPALGSSGVSLL